MLKLSEIKTMDKEVISKKIADCRSQLFNLKLQKCTTGLEKSHKLIEVKKDIARLKTILNEK